MKMLITSLLLSFVSMTCAQVDTSASAVTVSGYAEVYYTYDFGQPADHNRPGFIYSHNRHNEVNLNLGYIKAGYTTDRIRGNLAVAAGTYMNANYATEPGVLKNIYEANAGFKISPKSNLWLDGGIFASHIGFESAVSKDCWGLTRSILAENSPYYESGAKLTYITRNSTWLFSGLVLNGWQHIQRPEGNNTPAFGTQITYSPNSKMMFNYSTFIGNDKPDEARQMRYFHNLYSMFHFTEHFHLTAGFDFGMEQVAKGSNDFNTWYSPVLIVQIIFNDRWSVTGRGEYYADKHGVIISTGTAHGFKTSGYSLNFDYRIRNNAVWRVESRLFKSADDIFTNPDGDAVDSNTAVTTSIAISF